MSTMLPSGFCIRFDGLMSRWITGGDSPCKYESVASARSATSLARASSKWPAFAKVAPGTRKLIRFDTELRNRAQREARDRRMRAMLAAFDKPTFTAAGLDLGRGPRSRVADRVAYVNALLAILKVDQRDKLARTLERPTSKRWGAAIVGDTGPADDD